MAENRGTVVALGNFDGLHKGHKKVIAKAVEKAEELSLEAVVLLFDVHPYKALHAGVCENIMTRDNQTAKIAEMGAKTRIIDLMRVKDMDCGSFVKNVLVDEFNVKAVCCGYNYHFGKNRTGDINTLSELCRENGVELFVTEQVKYRDEPVSSSRIRESIAKGDLLSANAMLGEDFFYDFEVEHGDRIGSKLDLPTINQVFPDGFIIPLKGVYASKTAVDGKEYTSVTNIGTRPTLGKTQLRSETYIIGFSGDLYGKRVKVSLKRYIRGEKKFSSLDELKARIEKDCIIAKNGGAIMEKLNVKAVFFDFDDTLQSRKGAYRLYCEAFLSKYFPMIGEEERNIKLDQMEEYVDGGYKDREDYFPELIELWKWDSHPPMQELYDSFNEDYGKYVVMLPYAIDVLEEIKCRGYTTGIISNGVSVLQNTKLDTAGIRDMFDISIVSGDFGVYKPDRRIFDAACEEAGLPNEECLYVGDHPINDIKGALNAGMKAVRVNQGDFYNKDINPDIPTVEDLRDLLKML